jgi:uncharacterized coiled-coil DUF342 family protein
MENKSTDSKANEYAPNLEAIFSKRSINEIFDKVPAPPENQNPIEKPVKETQVKESALVVPEVKEESIPDGEEKSPNEEKSIKRVDWKSEAEKEAKKYNETRKWGKEATEKLSIYKRKLNEYKELGLLDDDAVKDLLDATVVRDEPESVLPLKEKLAKTWDVEIQNIKKYGDAENLDIYEDSLMHLLSVSSQDEIDDLFDDIKHLIEEDPVLFVKKSLEIGKDHYEDIYKDYSEVGNLKKFRDKYEEKLTASQKTIDKLEKEILNLKKKYDEDYDEKPNYRIPQSSGDYNPGTDSDLWKNPGKLLEKMNSGKYIPKG